MNKIVYTFNDSIITETFMQKVADFEGYSSTPYNCPGGVPTIGFGHACVYKDDKVTIEEASELLYDDLHNVLVSLHRHVDYFLTLPLGIQQALIDFVFNLGIGRFLSSSVLRNLQLWPTTPPAKYDVLSDKICQSIMLYHYCKGVSLRGLKKRRQWECFLIKDCLLQH